jgi:hypothetical protein
MEDLARREKGSDSYVPQKYSRQRIYKFLHTHTLNELQHGTRKGRRNCLRIALGTENTKTMKIYRELMFSCLCLVGAKNGPKDGDYLFSHVTYVPVSVSVVIVRKGLTNDQTLS